MCACGTIAATRIEPTAGTPHTAISDLSALFRNIDPSQQRILLTSDFTLIHNATELNALMFPCRSSTTREQDRTATFHLVYGQSAFRPCLVFPPSLVTKEWSTIQAMHVWVYKGDKKADIYLYLTRHNNFERVPETLLSLLGNLSLVIDFDIFTKKRLAQADITTAVNQLREKGYFLQLPPDKPVDQPC